MPAPPRIARLTRRLGRLSGLTPWQRPLRPARTAAWRVLRRLYPPPSTGIWAGVEAPVVPGARMRLDPRSLIEWEVLFTGYEPEIRELTRRSLARGGVAIDVGANAGAHTLAMAATGAEVIACEPNPTLRGRLQVNLELNGLSNVRVLPVALGAEPGRAVLHVPADPAHTGGASLVTGIHGHLRGALEIEVEVVTLDEIAESAALVKIDVEGFEGAVLAGGRRLLERSRPDLIFEYTRDWWAAAGYSLDDLLPDLRALGYEIGTVTWRGLRRVPHPAPERMNLWATARAQP